jgi:hypothetical protein
MREMLPQLNKELRERAPEVFSAPLPAALTQGRGPVAV